MEAVVSKFNMLNIIGSIIEAIIRPNRFTRTIRRRTRVVQIIRIICIRAIRISQSSRTLLTKLLLEALISCRGVMIHQIHKHIMMRRIE